jgi:putative tryptophan/tyrosine transport system substrate-binding protein
LARQGVGALAMQSDAFFNTVIDHIVALAKRHAVPVIYARREFAAAGGLLSYGSSVTEAYRQLGIYTGQVLKGVKPADLPILLPSRFELVINLTTAKALGIDVPLSLMVRADDTSSDFSIKRRATCLRIVDNLPDYDRLAERAV